MICEMRNILIERPLLDESKGAAKEEMAEFRKYADNELQACYLIMT